MSRNDTQTDKTIEEFKMVAKYLAGANYREYFNKNATPQIHTLEVHIVEELEK